LIVGILAGAAIGWLYAKQKTDAALSEAKTAMTRAQATAEALAEAREGEASMIREMRESEQKRVNDLLKEEMKNIATQTGERNREEFLRLAKESFAVGQKESEKILESRKIEVDNLIKPMRDEMEKMAAANKKMEENRVGAYQAIKRQLKDLGDQTENLGMRTTALSTALTTSGQARGNWGEVKLRRLFEMAGMSEHVDFFEQETIEGGGRPDYIVRLPKEGVIPIDSKASGAAFLRAVELEPGDEQENLLAEHAVAVKQRIKELSLKNYQENIEGDFDYVVMFIPSEAMAAAAFSIDPDLMDYALTKSVLVATPMTMLALLRTIALYWDQHALAEDASKIYVVSREMYSRVNKFIDHFLKVGSHLDKAGKSYNDAMRSYESRVLPQGRRLDELRVSNTLASLLPEPKEIEAFPDKTSTDGEE
jgi:DNA recombination protein RmuC